MSDRKWYSLDSLGGLLLFFCAIALVGLSIIIGVKSCSQEKEYVEITITTSVDSTGCISSVDKASIDSLTNVIKRANSNLYDRYYHSLKKEDNGNFYFTIGGFFLSIILSVFGFFGYRSFKSIEDRAELVAQDKANERVGIGISQMKNDIDIISKNAVDRWGKAQTEELQQQFSTLMSDTITPTINELKNSMKEMGELKERINKLEIESLRGVSQEELNEIFKPGEIEAHIKEKIDSIPEDPFPINEKEGGEL